jgi:predicted nucleic acid-binding protein
MYLIDTSAWIEYLRDTGSPACEAVGRLLSTHAERVCTTEPIVMELLAGAADSHAFLQLQALTSGLALVSVDAARDWHDAAALFRAARATGKTVRKLFDCLIAAVALRADATLVHRDADFDAVAGCTPALKVMSLR